MTVKRKSIVGVDTMIVVWGLRDVDLKGSEISRRAAYLLRYLKSNEFIVLLSTVSLGELLVPIEGRARGTFIDKIRDTFTLVDYDMRAAGMAANLHPVINEIRSEDEDANRRALKADAMIVSSCKVLQATDFYTHDAGCRRLAEHVGMSGHDLPTKQMMPPLTGHQLELGD